MTIAPNTLDRILDVLRELGDQVAHAAVAGPLNDEQSNRLYFALGMVSGLEASFRAADLAQAGDVAPIIMTRES
jgi:hypothetical protein